MKFLCLFGPERASSGAIALFSDVLKTKREFVCAQDNSGSYEKTLTAKDDLSHGLQSLGGHRFTRHEGEADGNNNI